METMNHQTKGETMERNVGKKVWFKGDEYIITSPPYRLFSGWWQDARRQDGKVVIIKWTCPTCGTMKTKGSRGNGNMREAAYQALDGIYSIANTIHDHPEDNELKRLRSELKSKIEDLIQHLNANYIWN